MRPVTAKKAALSCMVSALWIVLGEDILGLDIVGGVFVRFKRIISRRMKTQMTRGIYLLEDARQLFVSELRLETYCM